MSTKTKQTGNGALDVLEPQADETTQYDDLYSRNDFSDIGDIPFKGGSVSHSPDIIPRQNNPYQNPGTLVADGNWNKELGMDINAGLANYIYMRGMNLGTVNSEEAKMYLHYSRSSLILWPQDPLDPNKGWKHNQIPTASGAKFCVMGSNGVVPGGAKVATNDPFYWVPQPPPSGEHYCLIGRISTKAHPNEIPNNISNIGGMAGYITKHANMVWRNVRTIAPKNPVSTFVVNYNQGQDASNVHFYLKCTGLPVGSDISFTAGTAGPDPAIKLEKTRVTNSKSFTAGVDSNVPEQYQTNISYSYYSNGKYPPDPSKFKVELKAVYIPEQNEENELYRLAAPLEELGAPQHIIDACRKKYGIEPVKGIVVGTDEAQAELNKAAGGTSPITGNYSQETVDTYLKVKGLKWKNVRESFFGNTYTLFDVVIEPEVKQGVETDEVSLNSASGKAGDPILNIPNTFFGASFEGEFHFEIKTHNVPKGCEVAFIGGTQTHPIQLNKTEVSSFPDFTTGTLVDLPQNFKSDLNVSFYSNGKTLSPELAPTLTVRVTHIDDDGDAANGYVSLESLGLENIVAAGGPTPAKLVGEVIIHLTPKENAN